MKVPQVGKSKPAGHKDDRSAILELASRPVRMRCPDGKRRTVSLFRARLIELASPHCRRRLMCEDFIALVMTAARMSPEEFNCIDRSSKARICGASYVG